MSVSKQILPVGVKVMVHTCGDKIKDACTKIIATGIIETEILSLCGVDPHFPYIVRWIKEGGLRVQSSDLQQFRLDPALLGKSILWVGNRHIARVLTNIEQKHDGERCHHCKNFVPYVSNNMGDKFVCHSCLTSHTWMYKA
jgi:hypothetical protein